MIIRCDGCTNPIYLIKQGSAIMDNKTGMTFHPECFDKWAKEVRS